ncbi:hypothetical protein BU24DRAFT_466494 [Aaosphaeria arxii CBS 175.79]|uniref:Uncharacterized protein n=1 Tax=Aaosphaeria arxii CBS 175.79 TaxID=1450172 RepID=A0A6A5XD71_9PLEO|nr:uncharacterized protein BU24DRAFT_466494 [Aaosphaeria arxii CBS 175.79]KAF2010714.1 hypothetical protein BU24DRAFT_466494 [Aaosphaeria arxii CBS 175.79]
MTGFPPPTVPESSSEVTCAPNEQNREEPATETTFKWPGPDHYLNGIIPSIEIHEDQNGRQTVPSPLPIFPKPLALLYQNYSQAYQHKRKTWDYVNRTLPEIGSRLASNLLRHYFHSPQFSVRCPKSEICIFQDDQDSRSVYWFVTKAPQRDEPPKPTSPPEKEDILLTKVDSSSERIVLILAVETEASRADILRREVGKHGGFSFHASRRQHRSIEFQSRSWHSLALSKRDAHFNGGKIVILGNKDGKPVVEFYDCIRMDASPPIAPWGGPEDKSNAYSLEEDLENVDRMFRTIVDICE